LSTPNTAWSVAAITPLVERQSLSGRTLSVTFRCPVTSERANARYTVPAGATVSTAVARTARSSFFWGLRSVITNTIRSLFGHGFVGRIAADVANTAMNEAARTQSHSGGLSEGEKEAALIEAFRTVQGSFVWDPNRGAWVSGKAAVELLSSFEQMMAKHPATHPYDRLVLARMLVEVAKADRQVGAEESGWLTQLIPAEVGSIQELASRPPLTEAELRQCSPGPVRETLLAVAWALSIVDEEFDPAEQAALQRFGRGLNLSSAQVERSKDAAQTYVMDQALDRVFTWGGHDAGSRHQLIELANRLGMTEMEALEAEARFQRRRAR